MPGVRAILAVSVGLAFAVAVIARPAVLAQQRLDETAVVRVSVADLEKRIAQRSVIVVDVRDSESYRVGHIPGAWLVPVADVAQRVGELKKAGKDVVTYCS